MNGVQTRLKCKPNVKRCKRFVFAAHSPLLHPNTLKTKAIIHFQTDHILTRFVFPPLFSSGVGDGNLDEVLLYLATCNGLIIDVRDNGGGNLTNSTRIAARFTNEKTLTGYIQHKTGPGHNDFSKMEPIYLEPSNSIRWQKKVIILTNRRCYSATNDFVNAMRSLNKDNEEKRIIQLGDWTGGGSGLPFSSELPNGWSVRFSASPHFDKNKQPLEEGIEPDIAINMSESDQLKHKDTLIEKAFEILSE